MYMYIVAQDYSTHNVHAQVHVHVDIHVHVVMYMYVYIFIKLASRQGIRFYRGTVT